MKGYIKLAGVAEGSLEELLKDYLSYARQKKIPLWGKEKTEREIEELREVWDILNKNKTLPDSPEFPDLPEDKTKAVNMMITFCNQANYLIGKLVTSLLEKHKREGGLTERLYNERRNYRGF